MAQATMFVYTNQHSMDHIPGTKLRLDKPENPGELKLSTISLRSRIKSIPCLLIPRCQLSMLDPMLWRLLVEA